MSFDGLLNTTVNIQKKTVAQNSSSFQKTETWSNVYSNVRVRIDSATGGEYQGTVKNIGNADTVMFIPKKYIFDNVNYRVVHGSTIYDITLMSNAGGHYHHWEVYLQERK